MANYEIKFQIKNEFKKITVQASSENEAKKKFIDSIKFHSIERVDDGLEEDSDVLVNLKNIFGLK